ncbi:winged helix-turn-helix domain-containing protein [Shewanella abyssi]|uniref:winged helix-turn-helix domain-containing protein n=1 Tax=Shewanella abyssi TaxID=311789 RepID=UPI00200EC5EC|nr:winged helix-turn-helix domain-containing protein [Shewanella abyssi]MCL1049436.1 winged helix-turn-helix domain-containing protein [Shewanella abyssi]
MRWQIAQFVFCDQRQTLIAAKKTVQLEPMMVELLRYFCLHTDQIISKDQLIEQVWLGRIVSDNAVSKLITKLRKAFADDVRQPRFIATFPKKGYKFIAAVLPILEQTQTPESMGREHEFVMATQPIKADEVIGAAPSKMFSAPSIKPWLLVALCILAAVGAYFVTGFMQHPPTYSTYAKALTTDVGDELFAKFSPDGTRVAYMSAKQDRMHLMIKDVVKEQVIEISHGDNLGVGPADWSADGQWIVYLVATPQLCQYYLRSINGLELGAPRLIHDCPAGSYGKIAFTHDNSRLIYSESEGGSAPYSLFEINLTAAKTKRLNQPELFLGGNSQFDLHPTENKLLISSPDEQQWEGFYSLDLASNTLSLLFKQDAYICCGIWDHDGDRVVLMGEHPAHQLLSYSLSGKDQRVIHSGSQQISHPRRHSNGRDYLFSSGRNNENVYIADIVTNKKKVVANNSVDERLASFSYHSSQIAYVSLATGSEEIWLTDIDKTRRKKLTHFNDSRHYIDLIWAPEGQYILALTLNELHLIDQSTGQFEVLDIPQTEIRGVSFKSPSEVAYSIRENGQWRVYSYQIKNRQSLAEDARWQFVQYHPISDNTLWLDQKNQLYFGEYKSPVIEKKIPVNRLISGRHFNLKRRGDLWVWFERDDGSGKILAYFEDSNVLMTLVDTDIERFDIANEQLLYGQNQQINANIYQTKRLEL